MYPIMVEQKQYFLVLRLQCTAMWTQNIYIYIYIFLPFNYSVQLFLAVYCSWKVKKYIKKYFTFTLLFLFFILSSSFCFAFTLVFLSLCLFQWFLCISFCIHTTFPLSMSPCSDFYGFDGGCGCVFVVE